MTGTVTAALCSVRDEGPYIVDWVAYMRALGFDHIYLFQNNSLDGTDDLCAALDAAGYITYRDNSDADAAPPEQHSFPAQRRALGWAHLLARDAGCDYVFPVDIDEYLELPRDHRIANLIDRLDAPDAISFAWRVMGSNGAQEFDPAPVTSRFTRAAAEDDLGGRGRSFHQVKTLFRSDLTDRFNVHRPLLDADALTRWRAPDGADVLTLLSSDNGLKEFDYSYANLRHYHCKSRTEFLVKMFRGYASHGSKPLPQIGLPAFAQMDANDKPLPFQSPILTHAREIAAQMRADQSIAVAEATSLAKFTKLMLLVENTIQSNDIFGQAAALPSELNTILQQHILEGFNVKR